MILSKSVKSQGILFSGLEFISFLQDFELLFLSEKMKSVLQSDNNNNFIGISMSVDGIADYNIDYVNLKENKRKRK